MGKTRIIAETGAGQHGVATATVAALFGLPCTIFMGAVDVARQQPNVFRMKLLGAEVVAVESGAKTLRSEEHTSELQSLMRISYAVFCLKKKRKTIKQKIHSRVINETYQMLNVKHRTTEV